jgi:hypothetical protein
MRRDKDRWWYTPICESLLNSSRLRPKKPLYSRGRVACMMGELADIRCERDSSATEWAILQWARVPDSLEIFAYSQNNWHILFWKRATGAQSNVVARAVLLVKLLMGFNVIGRHQQSQSASSPHCRGVSTLLNVGLFKPHLNHVPQPRANTQHNMTILRRYCTHTAVNVSVHHLVCRVGKAMCLAQYTSLDSWFFPRPVPKRDNARPEVGLQSKE